MPVDMPATIAPALLGWYDGNARSLPWRSPPGAPPPDPYRVWLSEIMLQQTTVAAVIPYYRRFVARWPSVDALAAADDAELMSAWAGLGYYARARNLLACARLVVGRGGFPDSEAELRALPGIGRYTAAAIAAIAFGRPATVVDGNVERVVARLFAVEAPLPAAKPRLYEQAGSLTPERRPGDFAQAMMDLGATICTPRKPACGACPINSRCAGYRSGSPEGFPVRAPKRIRPKRHATIYWIERCGKVLLVRRTAAGLLGGMRGLPMEPPMEAEWRVAEKAVQHVFTHFALEAKVMTTRIEKGCDLQLDGEWWPVARLDEAGLPTLFAKAARIAIEGGSDVRTAA